MKIYIRHIKIPDDIRKQIANQLHSFESYFNKRKEYIGVKPSKKIEKYLNKIKGVLK